jgi:hypothetical protein
MLAQVNQGIMGHDACPALCTDADVLAPAAQGSSIQLTIPPSRTFNVQWTAWSRDDLVKTGAMPKMTAQVVGVGTVHFPSNEVDIFPASNREMVARGNIFGQANIDPALWSCESRLVFSERTVGPSGFTTVLCLASNTESCTSCTRPSTPGALHVIFPNAHLWLSHSWNNAQDYYKARSCSADLSTCIAKFEGFIDAFYLNPATGSFVWPCLIQTEDTDAHLPLPYPGLPRMLRDANLCFAGTTLQAFYDVTTFFPNYRDFGACGAIGPTPAASCAFTPVKVIDNDGDDDDD